MPAYGISTVISAALSSVLKGTQGKLHKFTLRSVPNLLIIDLTYPSIIIKCARKGSATDVVRDHYNTLPYLDDLKACSTDVWEGAIALLNYCHRRKGGGASGSPFISEV
jgi:hypothetical protein